MGRGDAFRGWDLIQNVRSVIRARMKAGSGDGGQEGGFYSLYGRSLFTTADTVNYNNRHGSPDFL